MNCRKLMIGSGEMRIVFNQTSIGWSHLNSGICCQDFSASYQDRERAVVTACDGHGGAVYVRSDRGAKFASCALINVLQNISERLLNRARKPEITEQLRVQVLCEWNALVERDLAAHPLSRRELSGLTEDERFCLKQEPEKAYGTTAMGAMLIGNRLVCISLGDGGCYLYRKGTIQPTFPENGEDEQVANLTHSLCQSDAGRYLQIGIFNASEFDGVLLCTDGVINPYRTREIFARAFAMPVIASLANEKATAVSDFITQLGMRIGQGDDVSLAVLAKERLPACYRKSEA